KTIEVRTLETNVRGTIYLYTSKVVADIPAARRAIEDHSLDIDRLPRGCLVGRVNLVSCRAGARRDADAACLPAAMMKSRFSWELAEPVRFPEPVRPRFLPYGVWFYPFRKRNRETSE
ncbi:MAG: hypothetical protein KDA75_11535, partial [Planctomycetaceae bacterium]|nr:hypothetical protein [Planctomycetaceae bacterium]